jgi:hypothetical protein
VIGAESTTVLNHIQYASWCSDDDVNTFLKDPDVLTDNSPSNTSMTLDVQEISEGNDNLLDLLCKFACRCKDQSLTLFGVVVNLLKDTDGKGGSFASTRLGLGDDIAVLENGHDGSLLDRRRAFKT